MNKLNRILIVILVLQLSLAAVVLWPRHSTTKEEQNLFPDLEVNRVVRVTISGADGSQIELAKQGAGWVMPDAGDYPVEGDTVYAMLAKVAGLEGGKAVTETSGSHERLGVADNAFERKVEIELDNGTRHTLYVGTSPTYGAAHVRVAGQDEVYLTSDLSASDMGVLPTAWIDRVYLSVPQEQVMRLNLENENGEFTFVRLVSGGELAPVTEAWSMADLTEDETLNISAVQTLLSRVSSVSLLRPLGTEEKAEYGMDNPTAVVTLRTQSDDEESKTYTLRVGAQDPKDNSYVVISSESPYYVRVSESTVQMLVEAVREDFIELPPTPEATPEG